MSGPLHYRSYGHGFPVVVILHGLLGSGVNWQPQAEKLAANGCRVILPDARNHGGSFHADTHNPQLMAGDLLDLLDHLDIGQIRLAGHSMGAMTAMELALNFPERVERLAVLDFAPRPTPSANRTLLEAMQALPLDGLMRQAVVNQLMEHVPDKDLVMFVSTNLSRGSRESGLRWRVNLQALHAFCLEMERWQPVTGQRFHGPTLFLAGADSTYVRPEDYPLIKRFFPTSDIHVIPDAGHWLHVDQPGALMNRLQPFLTIDN